MYIFQIFFAYGCCIFYDEIWILITRYFLLDYKLKKLLLLLKSLWQLQLKIVDNSVAKNFRENFIKINLMYFVWCLFRPNFSFQCLIVFELWLFLWLGLYIKILIYLKSTVKYFNLFLYNTKNEIPLGILSIKCISYI